MSQQFDLPQVTTIPPISGHHSPSHLKSTEHYPHWLFTVRCPPSQCNHNPCQACSVQIQFMRASFRSWPLVVFGYVTLHGHPSQGQHSLFNICHKPMSPTSRKRNGYSVFVVHTANFQFTMVIHRSDLARRSDYIAIFLSYIFVPPWHPQKI